MKLNVLFSMAMGFIASQATAVETVTGRVTDAATGKPLAGAHVLDLSTSLGTVTDKSGTFTLTVTSLYVSIQVSSKGYAPLEIALNGRNQIALALSRETTPVKKHRALAEGVIHEIHAPGYNMANSVHPMVMEDWVEHNTEEYAHVLESGFRRPLENPLSTFSISVDNASYTNARRYLQNGTLPPVDAVRVEEMINYFDYDYPDAPKGKPFSLITEAGPAPWNPKHHRVHIGIHGKKLNTEELPVQNLVFLIDVSGSMSSAEKLPLLKSSMKLLVDELQPQDRVSIVVYASHVGVVLQSTPASEKHTILAAINGLQASGSTSGGAGIQMAYQQAEAHYMPEGNNRIILATDGDFNVGMSSTGDLARLVSEKREKGIYLTVLGMGMGNYKDNRLHELAKNGNGNYYYIDNFQEARKIFVQDMRANLFTIAQDVKIQVEFNPAQVQAYRLIGYETRLLKNEEFNDDKKDAGELGAGHTVTALYEIVPTGVEWKGTPGVDPLKYQEVETPVKRAASNELLTLKLRYKNPGSTTSQLLEQPLPVASIRKQVEQTSDNFRFSAGVALFGQLLRKSEHCAGATFAQSAALCRGALGADELGYRRELLALIDSADGLTAQE